MKAAKDLVNIILVIFFTFFLILFVTDAKGKEYGSCVVEFVFLLILFGLIYLLNRSRPADKLTGREYELHCAKYLLGRGFKTVQTTPITGDYGADLTANDRKGNRWVFQCKCYKGTVGVKAVQEVCAARKHYNANKAAVMTNSKFTKNAKRLAMENDIELFEMID